jgi:hypothetical protein
VGVAALVRLITAAGPSMSDEVWEEVLGYLAGAVDDTLPAVEVVVAPLREAAGPGAAEIQSAEAATPHRTWSLASGAGARRLAEVSARWTLPQRHASVSAREQSQIECIRCRQQSPRASACTALCWDRAEQSGKSATRGMIHGACAQVRIRAAVQLLLVQSCGEIYSQHSAIIPQAALLLLLGAVDRIASHARAVDGDIGLRRALALGQADGQVSRENSDPPN